MLCAIILKIPRASQVPYKSKNRKNEIHNDNNNNHNNLINVMIFQIFPILPIHGGVYQIVCTAVLRYSTVPDFSGYSVLGTPFWVLRLLSKEMLKNVKNKNIGLTNRLHPPA